MIKAMKSLFFTAVLLCWCTQSHAISLSLDNSMSVESGADCDIATYRFGLNESWNGIALDLLVEVVEEENDLAQDYCIGIEGGVFAVHLRDSDTTDGDDEAFVDTVMTIVRRGTSDPVLVDRITATGFDLDTNGQATGQYSTGTDDIYITSIGAGYVSGNTLVTYSTGSFAGGHDVHWRGSNAGNCLDSPATPVVECRGSVSWTGGTTNQISTFAVRFQNDNAYGQFPANDTGALRLLQLSLEDGHAEELFSAISDYGDTPTSYGIASHPSVSMFTQLGYGLAPDHDASQQAGVAANGDDTDTAPNTPNYDDEDGIFRNGTSLEGQTLTAGVNEVIDVTTFGSGYLSGWVDLNHDGDFLDAGENVLSDVSITGTTTQITSVSMNIPLTAVGGIAYARFRFDTQTGLAHNGAGVRGEVEDYQVQIDPMDPQYNMVKTADLSTITAAGQIVYTFTFNNTGNVPLSNVTIVDPDIDIGSLSGCPIANLPVGGTLACTANRSVSQAQIDSGTTLTNTATPSAEDPTGGIATETSTTDNSTQTTVLASFSHGINKPAPVNTDEDGSGDVSAGDTLTYSITATNTGSGTLSNLVVDDLMISPSSQTCGSVAPTGTCTLTGTYTVTGADVSAGVINNTATSISDQTPSVSDSETVNVPTPGLSLSKIAPTNTDTDGSGDISVGDTLSYTVTATNTGSATLTNLVVNDPMLTPASVTCSPVASSGTCVLTGTYVVTGADVAASPLVNTATATADQTGPVDDTHSLSLPAPALALNKPAPVNGDQDGSGDFSLGDVLTYTITASNSGTATLTNVTVSDPLITPSSTSCALLASGADCLLTGNYTVTAADVTAGQINNTATADSDQTAQVADAQSVALSAPGLSLDKSVPANADEDGTADISAGDTLTYTITATNSGSTTLTNLVVNDPMLTPASTNCGVVAASGTCVLTGTYVVTQADVNSGSIVNTATATSNQIGPVDDTETATLPSPSLILNKPAPVNTDEDGSTDVSVGDTLTYNITATNNGTATLTGVVVSDPMIAPSTTTCASVPVSGTCVLSGTYSVTASDVTAGIINNTATADSIQTPQVNDSQSVSLNAPSHVLDKTAPTNADEDGSADISAGDTLTYTVMATNNGGSVLTNMVVNDSMLTPDTMTCASVPPGSTCVLTGTYTVTPADVVAGSIVNTANSDTDQTNQQVDTETVPLPAPTLALVKAIPTNADEDGSTDISVGDTLSYTITATNSGTANLTDLVVSDPMITPNSNTCSFVAANATCVLVGTYSVTAADVAAGVINNTATAGADQTASVDASRSVAINSPVHVLDKTTPVNTDEDGSTDISAGDTLTYTVTATNTGSATLTNMLVSDPMLTPDTNLCASLAPGATCVLTGTYVVTAADVTNGTIVNTASSDSDQTPPVSDTETVPLPAPALLLVKSSPVNADEDNSTDISAGDTLSYTITATNSGAATLTDLVVSDPMISPASNTCVSVATGGTCVLTGTYTVTAADVTAGVINNTASADSDQTGPVDDTQTVTINTPDHTLHKAAPVNADEDGSTDISAGDTLTYTITATNSGTATLTNMSVTDPMVIPDNETCGSVAPGAVCVLTGVYTVTPADVAAGAIVNTASSNTDQTNPVDDTQTVVVPAPALAIAKSLPVNSDEDASGDISSGDTLTYTVTATNSGTATLTNVVVNDPLITPTNNSCASVAPGATCVLTGTYSVVGADITAGQIDNTATADSDQTPPVDDSQTVSLNAPSHVLSKAVPVNADEDGSTDISAGDTLTYTITATNNGAATLTNMVVTDPMITPNSQSCASVAPSATCVLTGTYVVTPADVSAGSIVNTASSDTDQTSPVDDTETVVVPAPVLALNKEAPVNADEDSSGDISAGDTLSYTITATNNGTAMLTDLIVSDPLITPDNVVCALVSPGGTCVLMGVYSVTTADVVAGFINNTATADSVQTASVDDSQSVTLNAPSHTLDKAAPVNSDEDGSNDISAGDTLSYTITATNNGSAMLTNMVVNDPMLTPGSASCASVPAGATCVLTGNYTVTAADVAAGSIVNTADSITDQTAQVTDTETVMLPAPLLSLNKPSPSNADEDGSGDVSAGDTLSYTITATNSGSATLTSLVVSDPMITPGSHSCATVAPGGTCVLTGDYVVTAADVSAGVINNTATANADQTPPVDDTQTVALNTPSHILDKVAPTNADEDGSSDISAGDTLTYTITATNDGSATLTNMVVNDPMLTPATATCASVASGAQCVLTGTYVVAGSDVIAGSIVNTATSDTDQTGSRSDTETVVVPPPVLSLVKSMPVNNDQDGSGDISVGDTLTYTVTATNSGVATLTDVVVSDPMISPDTISCAVVTSGQNCILTGNYSVTAADITAGQIDNTASADSVQTNPLTDTRQVVLNAPSLSLSKAAPVNSDEDSSADISVGDTLTYTITATNNGSSNLTGVVVNDPLIVPASVSCNIVAPGANCILTGSYSVSASDVVAGQIDNTATANSDQAGPVDDTETVSVQTPALALNKPVPVNLDEDGSGDISADDTLVYTVTATNSGATNLTDVLVNDPLITPDTQACAFLAPGATCVLSGSYTVTTADVANGVIDNTATAVSTQTAQIDDSQSVALSSPGHVLDKSAPTNSDEDGTSDISAGDTLTYTVTATNNSAANLTNVVVTDPMLSPDTINCALLMPGETCVLTGTYTVGTADVAAGTIVNTASSDTDQTGSLTDTETVLVPIPELSLLKPMPANADEDGSGDVSAGDTLTYTITATNSGDATLTNVVVNDPLITPTSATCASIAATQTCVLTGTYSVTPADVTAGVINNTANADSDQTGIVNDSNSVVLNAPALSLTKAAPSNADEDASGDVSVGDTLTYVITATNIGSSNLTNVVVTDAMIAPDTATCGLVNISDTCVLTGIYSVTAADLALGQIDNTAHAESDQTAQISDSQSIILNAPSHALDKSAPVNSDEDGSTDISVGDTMTYTITATNNGSATLTNLVVNDPMLTPNTTACASVAPSATCVLTGDYLVTAADVAAGAIVNTADSISDQTPLVDDTETVVVPTPLLTLNKSAPSNSDEDGSGDISVGDTLSYVITAVNAGSATLTDVVVSDAMIAPNSVTCASVAPGANCVLTGDYTVAAADIGAGQISNTASAVSVQAGPVNETVTTPLSAPDLTLVKSDPVNADEDGSTDISVSDTLTYTVTASNTGSSNLTNVVVSDPMLSPDTAICASLPPAATCVLSGSYSVTGTDVTAALISNSATVNSDQSGPVSDTVLTPVPQPSHVLIKVLTLNNDEDGSGDISTGDSLLYTLTATNDGSAVLTNLMVSDPMISPASTTCALVTPGATCELSGDYVVTAADVIAGQIDNTATAQSDQATISDASHVVLVTTPTLALVKEAPVNADEDGSGDISVGDTLTYTITATNNGDANLTNVTVTDSLINPSTTSCALLQTGETCVLSGQYQVTPADQNTGRIVNTANANSDQTIPQMATHDQLLGVPRLELVKLNTANADEDGSADVSVGDTLTYTVTATNNGDVNLTNVVVNDDMINPASMNCAIVSAGDACVLTGTYTVTSADKVAGQIVNTAGADSDQTPPLQTTLNVPVPVSGITLVKSLETNADEDQTSDVSAGDTLTYRVTASNGGDSVLTNVVVSDPLLTPSQALCVTLAPGAACELTGTYVVAAADVAAGSLLNTASVDSDQLPPVEAEHTVVVPSPVLEIDKTDPVHADADNSGNISVGDELVYTITATNAGSAVLSNVVVNDPLLTPASFTCDLVAPGETCVLTGVYQVAANDASNGEIINTASANSDQTDEVTDSVTVPVVLLLPPVTQDDTRTDQPLGQPVTVDVLANDSDPENNIDPTTVQIIHPESGDPVTSLPVAGEGSWSIDAETGAITFSPEAAFFGDPTPIDYMVTDTTGLESNISIVTIDFEAAVSLTGTVWLDADRDGEIDSDEPVKPDWTLEIYNDAGIMIASTVTDADGRYQVENLIPGEYTVKFYNEAGVYIAESTTDGPVAAGASVDLPLPVDPSGIVYDSITREPVPNVTLMFNNSAGVAVDPVCLNSNQQGQTTGADGFYAFDIFPAAHPTCPDGETYTIEIVSVPATFTGTASINIPVEPEVYDSAPLEQDCTVDSIPVSGACEVQANAGAPQLGQDTHYYMSFTLTGGDTNVIFNHIPLDPVIAAAQASMRLNKSVNRSIASTGDVLYYRVTLENDLDDAALDVAITDDLPRGFRYIEGSATAIVVDAKNSIVSNEPVVAAGIDPVVFSGITVPEVDNGTTTIQYAVRVGAGVMHGDHTNTAQVTEGGTSNIGAATVMLVADPVLDQATLIGKVFHDRDDDGYQEDASASGIRITSDHFGSDGYLVGDLDGRSSNHDSLSAHQMIVNMPLSGSSSFQLTTEEGTYLSVDEDQQVTESHFGLRARGMTAQDIRVSTQIVNARPTASGKARGVLQITITNAGVHEQGLPGVRLATVGGLLIETDQAGRFHIPDTAVGDNVNGQQFILKLDTATLPDGATLTTENPRVMRISRSGLNVMNFGVKLPVQQSATISEPAQTVHVYLGSVFFDTDKNNIREDQRGVVEDIITNLRKFKSGRILIEAHTDGRQSMDYNIALAKRRAKEVEKELRRILGDDVMSQVSVEVDSEALKEVPVITKEEEKVETEQ